MNGGATIGTPSEQTLPAPPLSSPWKTTCCNKSTKGHGPALHPGTGRAGHAGFRLREGVAIGAKVTLRGERMYEFLDKLVTVSLPRVRDFHGVPTKSFDGRGNYTLGVKEQLIFPEINFDDVDKVRGLDIVIVTTANTDEEGRELLKGLGMPFAK